MKNLWVIVGAVSVVTASAGGAAGYLIAKKRLEKKYSELAEAEIEEAKRYFKVLYKVGDYETVEGTVKALGRDTEMAAATALKSYGGHVLKPADEAVRNKVEEATVNEVVHNVFGSTRKISEEAEAFAEEVRNRTEEAPYVISDEEYFQNDTDYQQVSLTYYAGDDVLTDDRDDIIEDPDELVGSNNLVRFGDWSNDPNVVYVRSDTKEMEFEITRSQGKYSEEVAGL